MANWGVPDYTPSDDEEKLVHDAQQTTLQISFDGDGTMLCWPNEWFVADGSHLGFDKATVHRYCVDVRHNEVADWQSVRLSMKGRYTYQKLHILRDWYLKRKSIDERATIVQVYNYLGALRRGGQLDAQNRIRKVI